jgi:broad specificity phosphatase PhoE
MVTKILLIRHGQTDWNLSKRWQGHTDTPLNAAGRAEAKSLASRLASWPIQAIYSSDLSRAFETAETVGRIHELEPVPNPSLRERNGGLFEGLTSEEMMSRYGDLWQKVRLEGAAPPDGESDIQVAERIIQAFEHYRDQHQDQMIAIVSHGGTLKSLMSFILGFPLGHQASIGLLGNTALSIIRIDDYGQRLALFNDSSHLDSLELKPLTEIKTPQTE